MTSTFEGQAAVVIGASSGIGRSIALALARRGAGLDLVGRDRDRLEDAAAAARKEAAGPAAPRIRIHAVDLTADRKIEELARSLTAREQAIDVLVHSIGRFSAGANESAPVEELDALYHTNVRVPFLLNQRLLPALRERRGQVVFINSSIVAGARGGVGQYAASKLGLKALADSLRDEVNPLGIRVLSIYPGRTATPMQASIFEAEGRPYVPERLLQPEDVAEMVAAALGLPRTAEVTDIHIRPMRKA